MALLKLAATQNEPKRAETKWCTPQQTITVQDQFVLTMSTIRQVLTIPLLLKEALFTWAFQGWVSLFKYLQKFKVVYQYRRLKRLIFDYKPIIVGSWTSRFKIFEFKCLWNQEGRYDKFLKFLLLEITSMPLPLLSMLRKEVFRNLSSSINF